MNPLLNFPTIFKEVSHAEIKCVTVCRSYEKNSFMAYINMKPFVLKFDQISQALTGYKKKSINGLM